MGVAPDELLVNAARHGGEIEPTPLLRHAGMKHHLEEEITELIAQLPRLAALHGVGHLIRLLDGVGRDGTEGLLPIPRAAVLGVAQANHQLEEGRQRLLRLLGRAHSEPSLQSL